MRASAGSPPDDGAQVVVIIADGARPDTLAQAMGNGHLPALTQLRAEGTMATITSSFPSVTGPAYAPFLMGRYPGSVGLPGLRWYDRSRRVARLPGHSRSYVGPELALLDRDLDPSAPTIFELEPSSIGALSVIGRGLARRGRIGRSAAFAVRTAATHFRGNLPGWLAIDRRVGGEVARRLRSEKLRFAFLALPGIDKTSHSAGHEAEIVLDAMRTVDETVATIRSDAERDGRWGRMHLWVTSDHGHSPVRTHEDLARLLESWGYRTLAHPWAFNSSADIAVMVSGNAMAHLYLQLESPARAGWPRLHERWGHLPDDLCERQSVDLLIVPSSDTSCVIRAKDRGTASLEWGNGRYSYRPETGDPLAAGELGSLTKDEAYDATFGTDYPDSIVQIAHLVASPRGGDIILSAARDWDFRARYEPIPHVSSHGALHREHMLVPLLLNRAPTATPRRTVDVMPSILAALGSSIPPGLDGSSFL